MNDDTIDLVNNNYISKNLLSHYVKLVNERL